MDLEELTIPEIISEPVGASAEERDLAPADLPIPPAPATEVTDNEQDATPPVLAETVEAETQASGNDVAAETGLPEVAREVFADHSSKPFTIVLKQGSRGSSGHFVPRASLEMDPALRTSGLLAALPPEELKTLVALLTFLSPNGDIQPTAWEVAEGLHISEGAARERLSRLARFRWQARPLVATLCRESGVDGYTLIGEMVAYREALHSSLARTPLYRTADRDRVIAASRARYAHPRGEVERQIATMQGWPLPSSDGTDTGLAPQAKALTPDYLLQRLLRLGVTAPQAEILLQSYTLEEINRQIEWLPYRGAKNYASYLVAAITGRYAEPGLLRMRREQGREVEEGDYEVQPSTPVPHTPGEGFSPERYP